jgi:hypothetical protein
MRATRTWCFVLLVATAAGWLVEPHVRPALRGHGWHGPPPPPRPTSPLGTTFSYDEFDNRILQLTLPSPTHLGPTFEQALAGIAVGMHRDELVVDWDALASAGVQRNAPVTIEAGQMTCAGALMCVLAAVDPVKLDPGFEISRGVIHVTTRERLEYDAMYEYDVADLLPSPDRDTDAYRNSLDSLTNRIEAEALPSSWTDRGGRTGGIAADGAKLQISQTQTGHVQVAYVLERLRWRHGLLHYLQCIATAAAIAGVLAFGASWLAAHRLSRRRKIGAFPVITAE